MQMREVKAAAEQAGVGLKGIKVKIDRDPDLVGRGVYGYAYENGKRMTLYPDAFTDMETLVRTLGHERTHLYQFKTFGKAEDTLEGINLYERGAVESEEAFWNYYKQGKK